MTHPLLPDLPGFSIEQVTLLDGVIVVLAHSQRKSEACPACAQVSSRIHSRYQRTLADLPWSGHRVRLVVQVCRFFCKHPDCPRKTFAELIPELAERSARRTRRLTEVLEHLGLALGGEPASRLTTILGIGCSPDTLLRLLRRLPDRPIELPRVVSLAEWAWRRGSRYGTIIGDLERRRRLDLLPDRDAASAAAWLARYPSIEIISRDRAGEYAEAARVGAPQAVQIADRFHLSQNLHEAIDRTIRRRFSEIHQLLAPSQAVVLGEELPLKRDDAAKAATQKRRRAQYERLKVLHEQGYRLAQIAAYLGMKHETVQKYLMEPPRPSVYKPRHGKLTRYKPYIHQRFFQESRRRIPKRDRLVVLLARGPAHPHTTRATPGPVSGGQGTQLALRPGPSLFPLDPRALFCPDGALDGKRLGEPISGVEKLCPRTWARCRRRSRRPGSALVSRPDRGADHPTQTDQKAGVWTSEVRFAATTSPACRMRSQRSDEHLPGVRRRNE
jgi:transposase